MEQMKSMEKDMPSMDQATSQQDQMDMMIKMMTEQHKAQDKIFFASGETIENDDFEAALLHYCAKDRDVSMAMQEYMKSMRSAMPAY